MKSKNNAIVALTLMLIASSGDAQDQDKNKSAHTSGTMAPQGALDYSSCATRADDHQSMVICMQNELAIQQDLLSEIMQRKYENQTRELVVAVKKNESAWKAYIERKCNLYLSLGGQRSELLQQNCILEETSSQVKYIDELIFSSENS